MNPRTFDILRLRAEGRTLREIGAVCGITKQRVSQIIKAERTQEQRERCARGEHWMITRSTYDVKRPDGTMCQIVRLTCDHCGSVVEYTSGGPVTEARP